MVGGSVVGGCVVDGCVADGRVNGGRLVGGLVVEKGGIVADLNETSGTSAPGGPGGPGTRNLVVAGGAVYDWQKKIYGALTVFIARHLQLPLFNTVSLLTYSNYRLYLLLSSSQLRIVASYGLR